MGGDAAADVERLARDEGRIDEVASVVHLLASDASSPMTGTTVVVDAGFTCR